MTDSDDDVQLSEYAQAALMEFLNEQKAAQERESAAQAVTGQILEILFFQIIIIF